MQNLNEENHKNLMAGEGKKLEQISDNIRKTEGGGQRGTLCRHKTTEQIPRL